MHHLTVIAFASALLVQLGCSKGEDAGKGGTTAGSSAATPQADPAKAQGQDPAKEAKGDPPPAAKDAPAAATSAGVEPGGIQRDADEGPAAVVWAVKGTVEVRRVGEAEYKALKEGEKLYPGDAIRTGEESTATVALADESAVELAEVSAVAIASRNGTADPASAAAVLSGVARFTVVPRAPGEGPFRVYTPAGVIVTKGTTYGVGVAASGDARVGVESGSVDVLGLGALDAEPVEVEAGSAVTLEAKGEVGAPAAWPADDWGTWRDETDGKIEIAAAVDAHGAAMAELDKDLAATYADLDASAEAVAGFEATAAASAEANDQAAYEAKLPDGAATIDASFAVAGRAEALTWAYAGRAALAHDLYVRHPAVVEARWAPIAPRVDAAVLWPKRYEVTSAAYLEPLRVQYYVHHPRGRRHAALVGVTVPAFYARVEPPEVEPVRVRGRVKTKVWLAPDVQYQPSPRPVWIAAPAPTWRANVRVSPPRARVAWYVRPPALKAKVLVGAPPSGRFVTRIAVRPPAPRASLRASWRVPVGAKIRVGAPDLAAGARARASWKVGVGAPAVRVRAPDVKAGVKAGVGVRAGAGVRGGAGGVPEVRGGGRAGAGAGVKAGVRVQVPAVPDVRVKIKAPSVKIKGEAKGKIKIGN